MGFMRSLCSYGNGVKHKDELEKYNKLWKNKHVKDNWKSNFIKLILRSSLSKRRDECLNSQFGWDMKSTWKNNSMTEVPFTSWKVAVFSPNEGKYRPE